MAEAKQTEYGKAFEYAVLNALRSVLGYSQKVDVIEDKALETALRCYACLPDEKTSGLIKAALAAVRHILYLEPQLNDTTTTASLVLSIQDDSKGQLGDVRDVLIAREQSNWEIGVSCKHNHQAVKHSRLSKHIDFADKWLGYSCSKTYFDSIIPIFEHLESLEANRELWRNIANKDSEIYRPVLDAFIVELSAQAALHNDAPKKLVQYLLGRNDFYKVISNEQYSISKIQAFNMYGTLNQKSVEQIVKIPVNIPKMPSRIIHIEFLPDRNNTIQVICDHGWTIKMRIHNASERVEPSLKFDVTLEGIPPELYTHFEPWELIDYTWLS